MTESNELSLSRAFDPIVVDLEELHVEKDVFSVKDQYGMVVKLTLESLVDVPLQVSLVEQFPSEGGPDEVRFHPDHDPNNWTRSDEGRLVYETEFSPMETKVTVYGFETNASGVLSWLLDPPTVESSRILPQEEMTPKATSGSITSDMGAEPSSGEFKRGSSVGAIGEASGNRGLSSSESPGVSPSVGGVTRKDEEGIGGNDPLVRQVVHEIENGVLRDDELESLRTHLGMDKDPDRLANSVEELHDAVSKLQHFRDTIEEDLDRESASESALTQLREDLDAVSTELDDVVGEVEHAGGLAGDLETLEEQLETCRNEVQSIELALGTIQHRNQAIQERIGEDLANLREDFEEFRRTVTSNHREIRENVREVIQWRDRLVEGIEAYLEDFEEGENESVETIDSEE